MNATDGGRRRGARIFALAAATILFAAPGRGQDARELGERADAMTLEIETYLQERAAADPARQERRGARERDFRSDESYVDLIQHLELGMSALAELGRRDVMQELARIAEELRGERRAARAARAAREGDRREENDEVREVRRRLKVMRTAVDAYLEAGMPDAAHRVEQAMHARELAIERRTDPEARRIRESAPDRGVLAELLARAAGLYSEWGDLQAAQELAALSETYGQQWRRRQAAGAAERERPAAGGGLEDRRKRVEILRWARAAHAEAGQREMANVMSRIVHVGELQLEGAPDLEIARAFEGLTMGMVIEGLQGASALHREWGHPDRAELCYALAEFYAARERERPQEARPQEARRTPVAGAQERTALAVRRIAGRVEELQRELDELKAILAELARDR